MMGLRIWLRSVIIRIGIQKTGASEPYFARRPGQRCKCYARNYRQPRRSAGRQATGGKSPSDHPGTDESHGRYANRDHRAA